MPVFGVKQAKLQFFDRQVISDKDRKQKRAMSRYGAFVRRDARQSMKKSSGRMQKITTGPNKGLKRRVFKPSPPGQPPRAIEGSIKKFLFFLYEPQQDSVIIGPVFLSGKKHGKQPVTELHEHGGTAIIQKGKRKVVRRFPARSYMKPAGEKNLDNFRKFLRDT